MKAEWATLNVKHVGSDCKVGVGQGGQEGSERWQISAVHRHTLRHEAVTQTREMGQEDSGRRFESRVWLLSAVQL